MAESTIEAVSKVKTKPNVCRASLTYQVEKELINKQNRHIHITDNFVVPKNGILDLHIFPIQEKFYSKHYANPPCYKRYLEFVKDTEYLRKRTLFPVLESQVYGWIPGNINLREISQLNFNTAPKLRCDMTIYGEKLISEKHTERPEFNGHRFFVR